MFFRDSQLNEERTAVCIRCHYPVGDHFYEVDGKTYCEDCFHDLYRMDDDEIDTADNPYCEECGRNFQKYDIDPHKVEGSVLCSDCTDAWYRKRTRDLIYGIA